MTVGKEKCPRIIHGRIIDDKIIYRIIYGWIIYIYYIYLTTYLRFPKYRSKSVFLLLYYEIALKQFGYINTFLQAVVTILFTVVCYHKALLDLI